MRRFFLCALVAVLFTATAFSQDTDSEVRNILFIMGDDHAAYAVGAYGNEIIRTPNLDKMSAAGIRFDRAYVNSPICSASRQSILTGQLPHTAGVNLLFTPLRKDKVTIADHLKAAGFTTGAIGKMHFNGFKETLRRWGYPEETVEQADDHHGFDVRIDVGDYRENLKAHSHRDVPADLRTRTERGTFEDPALFWNAEALPVPVYEKDSEAQFFADQAISFMKKNRDERFCLWLSFREPHTPFSFPVEYAGAYDPADLAPLPEVGPEDEPWIPKVFSELTDDEKRGITAAYYASVEHLDNQIGRVMDALDEMGLGNETLVVYVGDHGYLLGHHGRFEKHSMWEEAVRSPLIMKNIPRLGQGRATDALVELIDLVPTIVDVLDVSPMETATGESLVPLLDGVVAHHRNHVFSEYLVDDMVMVRSDRWKYVFTAGRHDLALGYATGNAPPGITHLLFDVVADPGETKNLADDPGHGRVLAAMKDMMLERFKETHPEADQLPSGVTIDEAIAWFARPRDPVGPGAPLQ